MNFLERVGLVSQVKVGDYVVSANKPLGNGAFGTVNVGHKQTNAKEIVAIKIVRRHAKNDYLVQREIQLLQELKNYGCENILTFFFSEKDSTNFYLVTEFCNGGTLTKLFTAKKRLSDVEAKIFMRQIASAMKFLDKEEIAHRDLKPDNILVNSNKVPNSVDFNDMTFKIADFGLATKIPKGKTANSKCGSCFYMAPEIFKVKYRFYDRKVDLWSIGVILYQGMVGVLPFKVRNMRKFEDMERLMSTPVNAVLPTWLSLDARDLINSLLTYCPTKRIDFEKFFEHPFLVKDKSTPPPPAAVPFPRLSATSVGTLVNTSSFEKQEDLLLNGMLAPTTIHDVSSNLMDFVIVDSQCCYMKSQKLDDKEILPKITPRHAEALCILS